MTKIDSLIEKCRKDRKPNNKANEVICWTEPDILDGKKVQAFCMILRTTGCSWDKCTMCNYNDVSDRKIDPSNILNQFVQVMNKYQDQKIIKIFNSGSFFNDLEMTPSVREKILKSLHGKTEKLIVETRAEYVNNENLLQAKNQFSNLEIAIGLESSNDDVLKYCINKGMTFSDFVKAAKVIKDTGVLLKTYILLKPPFLTEREAIEDTIKSIEDAAKYSDEISINPTNIQRHTVVEYLWHRNEYRPPWLWSLSTALIKGKSHLKNNVRLMSSPSGGGSVRGVHNCPDCDKIILKEIQDFSLTQDMSVFKKECRCKEQWLDNLEIEMFAHTSANLERILKGIE